MHQKYAKFVVLFITDDLTGVQSRVFFSRERARAFTVKLQADPTVQACGTYRIGTKLGSYLRTSPMADRVLEATTIE